MRKSKPAAAPEISPAEWRILELLWQSAPQSAAAIREQLAGVTGWALATVNTLLRRLADKAAVSSEKAGREFLYSPAVTREACVQRESGSLVDRIFGGKLTPLVAAFVETGKLSAADLEELEALLARTRLENPKQC
jgi:predicted transcriptional regulator